MKKTRPNTANRLITTLILIFFMGSGIFSTEVPSWCMEVDKPDRSISGHLHLFECHEVSDEASAVELLRELSTVPAHGDDHCNLCLDIPINSAKVFHSPVGFKKEMVKLVVIAADYWKPSFLLPYQKSLSRSIQYGFSAYLPNQLLESLRTVVLLN